MNALLIEVTKDQLKNIPEIKAGMHIRVHEKIKEKDRERIQIFEGIVLAKKHGKGINATFTVRKVVDGIGVEKTWPLHSPMVEKIEIIKTPRLRRAKLYFLRHLSPTKIRKKLSVFESVVAEQKTSNNENDIANNNEKVEQNAQEAEK